MLHSTLRIKTIAILVSGLPKKILLKKRNFLVSSIEIFINQPGLIMNKKSIAIILAILFLYLPGCSGTTSKTKSFMREDANLGYIETVAIFPFEGGGRAPRIREFTMTQVLASGIFDIVDKGTVDNIMRQEVIAPGEPLDLVTIKRLGQRLNVQGVIFGSVEEIIEARGNASYPVITITMRLIDTETGVLLWQASGRGSGYSLSDRLFGTRPKDSFDVTMDLLSDLFATMSYTEPSNTETAE